MRGVRTTQVLLLVAALSVGASIFAQSMQANGEKIRQLREEIRKRETADVPADLVDLNRSKLIERRAELRTALKVEIENLRKHRVLLGSLITSEEAQKIDDSLQSFEAEISRQGIAIQRDLAADTSDQKGVPGPGQSTTKADDNSLNGKNDGALNPPLSVESKTKPKSEDSTSILPRNPKPFIAPNLKPKLDMLPAAPAVVKDEKSEIDCQKQKEEEDAGKPSSNELNAIVCGLVRDITERRAKGGPAQLDLSTTQPFELIKILIAKRSTPKYLVEAEETRLDKQVGGSPGSAGSNSLVAKGGTSAILGFAVENGGLTQSINGSAVTFRGNPVGLINAFANKGFVPSVKEDENDAILRFLRRTSFAFTFNTDRGSEPGVLTATRHQLASFSTRIELINQRRPSLYIKDWEHFLGTRAQQLANTINQNLFVDLTQAKPWIDPALQAWYEQTQIELGKANDSQVSAVLQAQLDKLPVKELGATTIVQLDTIEKALGLYMNDRDELLNKINRGTLVTFEYVNKREVNAPDTSTFNFIAEKGTGGGKVDFTFNGSLTMFNNLDELKAFIKLNPTLPPARRVRDFQFAGQIDVPLGKPTEFGNFVLFAAGRYERLLQNTTTDLGAILPGTKGDIAYLQTGFKVPLKGTGFKIPISVTFANRSELVKEKHVRGNIGFTLDLDSFFAKFKPF